MFRKSLFVLGVSALVALVDGVAQGDLYSGNEILPKHERLVVKIGSKPVADEADFEWPVRVERVNGQWLWITDDGSHHVEWQANQGWVPKPIRGWVSKNDVILLESDPIEKKDALEYFTECLRENGNAGWAYWLRGVILGEKKNNWNLAIMDFDKAIQCASGLEPPPWLDNAHVRLGESKHQLAFNGQEELLYKLRHREIQQLDWNANVPLAVKDAVDHFRIAALIRPRPNTFREWGIALTVRDWNQFQRRIFIYFLENPDTFEARMKSEPILNPLTDGCTSAICLYEYALAKFPSYAGARYYRGTLYEYIADHQVFQMTSGEDWKKLTDFDGIAKLEKKLRKDNAKLEKLKKDSQDDADEMDGLMKLSAPNVLAWRIAQLNQKRKKAQVEIDAATDEVEKTTEQLKQLTDAIKCDEKVQAAIQKLQSEATGKIQHLVELATDDYSIAIMADPSLPQPYLRAGEIQLMLLDPTGRIPRKISGESDPPTLARAAKVWAEKGFTKAEIEDTANAHALATYAAALNANGDYEEAIRMEKSALDQMTEDEKTGAQSYYELYKRNKTGNESEGN